MKLSRFDLIDRFNAWVFTHETTHKQGHDITYDAIAMDDVNQTLDEIMNENDSIHIIAKRDFIINDYVWYNERIHKVTELKGKEIEIYDIEVRRTRKVNKKLIRHVH